jgi:hypothetical protein
MARPEITGKRVQRFFTKRQLADRYSTCVRTIERWAKSGRLPPPIIMPNGRWGFPDCEIEANERDRFARQIPGTEPEPELVAPAG